MVAPKQIQINDNRNSISPLVTSISKNNTKIIAQQSPNKGVIRAYNESRDKL